MTESQEELERLAKRDRTNWPPGPWMDEPDRIEWRHEGFPCLMVRGRGGAWCGYVGVPPGHPWHGVGYDDVKDADGEWVTAHGGLTYSDKCQGGICHVPREGEPVDVWWLGFDCLHAWDWSPQHSWGTWIEMKKPSYARMPQNHPRGETYRDVPYVRGEVNGLAEQAMEAGSS